MNAELSMDVHGNLQLVIEIKGKKIYPVVISLEILMAITTLSRAQIYAMMEAGEFPKSIKISARRVVWRVRDVLNFLEDRARKSQLAQCSVSIWSQRQ